jgi:hypothetical protein
VQVGSAEGERECALPPLLRTDFELSILGDYALAGTDSSGLTKRQDTRSGCLDRPPRSPADPRPRQGRLPATGGNFCTRLFQALSPGPLHLKRGSEPAQAGGGSIPQRPRGRSAWWSAEARTSFLPEHKCSLEMCPLCKQPTPGKRATRCRARKSRINIQSRHVPEPSQLFPSRPVNGPRHRPGHARTSVDGQVFLQNIVQEAPGQLATAS